MGFSELATVAFVEDEDHTLVLEVFHGLGVALLADRRIELLERGDDELGVLVTELSDELAGVVGAVNAPFAETVEFPDGLVIEVLAVHHKDDLIDMGRLGQDLGGFERGERLS